MNKINHVIFLVLNLILIICAQYPDCTTPSRRNGKCVPVIRCQSIYATLTSGKPLSDEIRNFILRSKCQNPAVQGNSVCCQLNGITSDSTQTVQAPVPVAATTNGGGSSTGDISKHRNINLLDTDECGLTSADRIAHGKATQLFEYPWMALLGYRTDLGDMEYKCGGTLINPNYVLTAAHCVQGLRRVTLETVRLGEHNRKTNPDCKTIAGEKQCANNYQEINVGSTVVHESYNRPRFANDIALIRLSKPATLYEDEVVPICLPVTEQLRKKVNDKYIITGWGTTENGTDSDILLFATIPFVKSSTCQQKLTENRLFAAVSDDSQICVGGTDKVDSCQGDSGGPLQYVGELKGPKMVQFGVVSFGINSCGDKSVPGVYAKVSYYMPWILDNLKP
uniref:CLIP domain-containing serine protease n=1 Tax=Corethrella appendiculata TaxID=1370023 RepID=U5EV87_9DIPT